jgi:hypothetical protein
MMEKGEGRYKRKIYKKKKEKEKEKRNMHTTFPWVESIFFYSNQWGVGSRVFETQS